MFLGEISDSNISYFVRQVSRGAGRAEEQKQLEDAADALAIDNPKFGFVSGIHTW
jgi:hypothetical protein